MNRLPWFDFASENVLIILEFTSPRKWQQLIP
jgi:hypothetical protein